MFLEKLLPAEGLFCVAMLNPKGGFKHYFRADLSEAQALLANLNSSGKTCYIAQATYDTKKIEEAQAHNAALPRGLSKTEWKAQAKKLRSQDNALLLKNFFLDIDCGEKWPLKTQGEAVGALKEFLGETGLPFPAVVNSGNGLYAHWVLAEAIPAQKWRQVAFILKNVVAAYSQRIGGDASRTSDTASVLRPPGTTNRKPGFPEKDVVLLKDAEPVEFMDFVRVLTAAAKKKKVDHTAALPPAVISDVNAEFFGGLEQKHAPSDANLVADNCAQLALMRDSGGDIVEPLWYACIGVLVKCIDGESIVHEWSKGYPGYSAAEADDKIAQWANAGVGPSTCASIGLINPEGCVGCPHNGKVKSPIILGKPEPKALALPEEQCDAPDGFKRGVDGLYVEVEGRWICFYDQDLYPDRLAYDESLGYEVMTIKHSLPHEGDMECTMRSSLVNDPKALLTTLADNHIKVVGVKEKKYMTAYLESYQAKLQRQRRMSMLLCQMGWKDARNGKPMFVLGKKIIHHDGTVEEASLARNVPGSASAYHCKGSLEKWSAATKVLDKPGMEPFAFSLLAGGFGAPLMKFTGFDGALVSLVGDSGAGKTLLLRWIQSVWGQNSELMMLRDDTKNALVSRLGINGNLPMTIDEITNIDGMELSSLVYRITQGRDKIRLTRNAEEKALLNTWNTLAVTSSNESLIDKLSGAKHDASAEINRLFEYPVMKHREFQGETTTQIYWTLQENYGHAGVEYAKWLVQNIDTIKSKLDIMRGVVDGKADITGEERFWSAVVSAAILGGIIAQKLGLIQFDVMRVLTWAADTVFNMRGDKNELTGNAIDMIAQFIDSQASNRLIVKGDARRGLSGCIALEEPRGALNIRYELDSGRMFLSRAALKAHIARRFGSYTQIKKELMATKALIDPNRRKALGAGTTYSGAQQACWELDMRCRALGQPALKINDVINLNLEAGV